MQDFAKILKNLFKIDDNYIGAIDNTVPYFCEHSKHNSLKSVFCISNKDWYWNSISSSKAESVNPVVVMFIKHIDLNAYNLLLNKRKIIIGSCAGLLINNVLFLNEKYKSLNKKHEIWSKLSVSDHIDYNNNSVLKNFSVRAYFNLMNCYYYCVL